MWWNCVTLSSVSDSGWSSEHFPKSQQCMSMWVPPVRVVVSVRKQLPALAGAALSPSSASLWAVLYIFVTLSWDRKKFSDVWWCKWHEEALVWCFLNRLEASQNNPETLRQYFHLPDSITPTHLTFCIPDYICVPQPCQHFPTRGKLMEICSSHMYKPSDPSSLIWCWG